MISVFFFWLFLFFLFGYIIVVVVFCEYRYIVMYEMSVFLYLRIIVLPFDWFTYKYYFFGFGYVGVSMGREDRVNIFAFARLDLHALFRDFGICLISTLTFAWGTYSCIMFFVYYRVFLRGWYRVSVLIWFVRERISGERGLILVRWIIGLSTIADF